MRFFQFYIKALSSLASLSAPRRTLYYACVASTLSPDIIFCLELELFHLAAAISVSMPKELSEVEPDIRQNNLSRK